MKHSQAVFEVARWEFLRYLRPKQQLIGMLITFAAGAAVWGVQQLAARGDDDVRTIAVIGGDVLPVADHGSETLRFVTHRAEDEALLDERLSDESIDGILRVNSPEHAELTARRRAGWQQQVTASLAAARQQSMMTRAGLDAGTLASVLAPPQLDVHVESGRSASRGERVVFVIVCGLMIMTVFIGMSYVFASITGEKQIRVTEQVISAIPAQSWIDGKILGIVAVSLVSVANSAIAVAALFFVMGRASGRTFVMPENLGDPLTLLAIVLFAVLGLLFWMAFLGAVAAMIDDPHNSNRGVLLFVPILATMLPLAIAKNPDGGFARVLALLPPTAPSAMPARMLIGDVHVLEVAASLALLLAGVLLLRTAAGRVFRVAMLMYGKEPSWQEVRRWVFTR